MNFQLQKKLFEENISHTEKSTFISVNKTFNIEQCILAHEQVTTITMMDMFVLCTGFKLHLKYIIKHEYSVGPYKEVCIQVSYRFLKLQTVQRLSISELLGSRIETSLH